MFLIDLCKKKYFRILWRLQKYLKVETLRKLVIIVQSLPCFSKILERIIHNRVYSYLVHEKIYLKQFGFQKGHSIEHAIAKLADMIHKSFENYKFSGL